MQNSEVLTKSSLCGRNGSNPWRILLCNRPDPVATFWDGFPPSSPSPLMTTRPFFARGADGRVMSPCMRTGCTRVRRTSLERRLWSGFRLCFPLLSTSSMLCFHLGASSIIGWGVVRRTGRDISCGIQGGSSAVKAVIPTLVSFLIW